MKIPKFKIGDKVKVLRAPNPSEEHLWDNTWYPPGMDKFIGGKYIIKAVDDYVSDYEFASYRFEGYGFPEFVLQKDIVVGQQLLFSFMEE